MFHGAQRLREIAHVSIPYFSYEKEFFPEFLLQHFDEAVSEMLREMLDGIETELIKKAGKYGA